MKLIKRELDEYEEGGRVVYFSLLCASYGLQRIGDEHRYQIDLNLDFNLLGVQGLTIYKKAKKPKFRNLILLNLLALPLLFIFWVLFFVVFCFSLYIIGAIDHFNDFYSEVEQKTFNWINFVLAWVFLFSTIYFSIFA